MSPSVYKNPYQKKLSSCKSVGDERKQKMILFFPKRRYVGVASMCCVWCGGVWMGCFCVGGVAAVYEGVAEQLPMCFSLLKLRVCGGYVQRRAPLCCGAVFAEKKDTCERCVGVWQVKEKMLVEKECFKKCRGLTERCSL